MAKQLDPKHFSANELTDKETKKTSVEVLMEKSKSENRWYAHILNRLAYMHYGKGEKSKAKEYFDEYLKVYPAPVVLPS